MDGFKPGQSDAPVMYMQCAPVSDRVEELGELGSRAVLVNTFSLGCCVENSKMDPHLQLAWHWSYGLAQRFDGLDEIG